MKAFEKIIGYNSVKQELMQIADTLKNLEPYEKLGAKPPKGLLLHGEPGVGKSLMASCLIEESGLKAYVCRKDKPDGEFVNEIKSVFQQAVQNAPSIVFLDDMDKFANGDPHRPDEEEYVTVQSCIDEVKTKMVFVLATANSLRCLPSSLLRTGRFDRRIYVKNPSVVDAEQIIRYYLTDKGISNDLDIKSITKIMDGYSCADTGGNCFQYVFQNSYIIDFFSCCHILYQYGVINNFNINDIRFSRYSLRSIIYITSCLYISKNFCVNVFA